MEDKKTIIEMIEEQNQSLKDLLKELQEIKKINEKVLKDNKEIVINLIRE